MEVLLGQQTTVIKLAKLAKWKNMGKKKLSENTDAKMHAKF